MNLQVSDYIVRSADVQLEMPAGEETKPRLARMTLATDTPIERVDIKGNKYYEVLDHSPGSMVAPNRIPLIQDHTPDKGTIGRIEKLEQKDGATYADVKLSRSRAGRDAFQDIEDGIRDTVSIGARILDYAVERSSNKVPTLRITRWAVMEASLLSMGNPADPSATIALRSAREPDKIIDIPEEVERMKEEHTPDLSVDAGKLERERTTEILALAKKHNDEGGFDAVSRGLSVNDYRAQLLERVAASKPLVTQPEPKSNPSGIDPVEMQNYSVARAIQVMNGTQRGNCLEREVADELERKAGRASEGIWVPWDGLVSRATSETSTNLGTLPKEIRPDMFEQALRNSSVVAAAGARVLTGLVGTVEWGVAAGTNVFWTNEIVAPTEGAYSSTARSLSAKHLKGFVPFSRTLATQASPSVEQSIREDLQNAVSEGIDLVALYGGGTGEPSGIMTFSGSGLGSVTATSNVYKDFVNLEAAVDGLNIPNRSRSYLINSKTSAALKTTPVDAGSGIFVYSNGTVNGTSVHTTNSLVSNGGVGNDESDVIYGEFSQIALGFFGPGVELSLSEMDNAGNRSLRIFVDVDVAVTRPNAFAKLVGFKP